MITRQSTRVATGGMITALCVLLMFMTGLFPFATFALPAFAGFLLIVVVVEIGAMWAWVVYVGVSILSFLIAPDREAAVLFVAFFGYYPILKATLEKIRSKVLAMIVKLLVFNGAVGLAYAAIVFVFQMQEVIAGFLEYGKYELIGFWALLNITFVVYDFALTKIIIVYIQWFRPKFLRRH